MNVAVHVKKEIDNAIKMRNDFLKFWQGLGRLPAEPLGVETKDFIWFPLISRISRKYIKEGGRVLLGAKLFNLETEAFDFRWFC